MPIDLDEVFRRYDPPKGGLRQLRARLERTERRARRRRLAWTAGACLVLVGMVAYLLLDSTSLDVSPSGPPPSFSMAWISPDALTYPALATMGLLAPQAEPVVIDDHLGGSLALQRVPTQDDNVVFYLIASLPPEPDRHGDVSGHIPQSAVAP